MTTETIEMYRDGALVESVSVDIPTDVANERLLLAQARAALQTNRDFLAVASPGNAQVLAQVRALTRQMNALIRLAARDLSGTD